MIFPSWRRLVDIYATRIARLMAGSRVPWDLFSATPEFRRAARQAAESMAMEVANVNARSWREAAFKSRKGKTIYEALQAEIEEENLRPVLDRIARRNAQLIGSVGRDVSRLVTAKVREMQEQGRRPAEIERYLRLLVPTLAKSRIELVARTEVSRAETDLTRARAENLDLNWYVWQTSEDDRVRPSHRNMDQVLVAWDSAPAPERLIRVVSSLGEYHAGCCPNCRCLALPLASLDEVTWPARVHRHNRIAVMTRTAFARISGLPQAA